MGGDYSNPHMQVIIDFIRSRCATSLSKSEWPFPRGTEYGNGMEEEVYCRMGKTKPHALFALIQFNRFIPRTVGRY